MRQNKGGSLGTASLSTRELQEADLVDCLGIDPTHRGDEIVGREKYLSVWRDLIHSVSCLSRVLEIEPPRAGHRIIGFGSGVFVAPAFADEEMRHPRPGLNARILASIHRGQSVVLNEARLRHGNTQAGLDLVILCASLRRPILTEAEIGDAFAAMAAGFLRDYRGYRMNRWLTELTGEPDRQTFIATGVWRVASDFDDLRASHSGTQGPKGRALAVMTREEAFAVAGSVPSLLFQYREPILSFGSADQQLLLAALEGLTDEELSAKLQVGVASIKKRWLAIFERFAQRMPGLLPRDGADGNHSNGRGRQKRHRLVAYLHSHPEELRPLEPASRS